MTFRTGRSLGRTLYKNDQLIGIMDRPEDAAMVVEALNGPAAENARLRELLEWLDKGGGLGLDIHAKIRAALGNR